MTFIFNGIIGLVTLRGFVMVHMKSRVCLDSEKSWSWCVKEWENGRRKVNNVVKSQVLLLLRRTANHGRDRDRDREREREKNEESVTEVC